MADVNFFLRRSRSNLLLATARLSPPCHHRRRGALHAHHGVLGFAVDLIEQTRVLREVLAGDVVLVEERYDGVQLALELGGHLVDVLRGEAVDVLDVVAGQVVGHGGVQLREQDVDLVEETDVLVVSYISSLG